MTFNFIYNEDYDRIIPAVMLDARQDILSLQGMDGWHINTITDVELAKITSNALFYRIENEFGSLIGYFILGVNMVSITASLAGETIRHNFIAQKDLLTNQINTFITNGNWLKDYLY